MHGLLTLPLHLVEAVEEVDQGAGVLLMP
ncbi:hypothetical protein RDABS01_026788 [Bienertia sinuspersici]